MAAGVTDLLWSVEDLVALWELTSSGGQKERLHLVTGIAVFVVSALTAVADIGTVIYEQHL